jgi:hypothetical protein
VELLIGCPVAHREWILTAWFAHVRAACDRAGLQPNFVFVVDPRDASWARIRDLAPGAMLIECVTTRSTDRREWNTARYRQMVDLRNTLLNAVQLLKPDVFLSLDSDILLHPDQIKLLLETLAHYDAVGGRCYMTPSGVRFPSWGRLSRTGALQRTDSDGILAADVIMAIKVMSPAAYSVSYQLDTQGEDVGWSRACAQRGLKLGWDGRVIAKHVLAPYLLVPVDPRVGF